MEGSRRSFLKLAGVCALGLGVKPAVNAFSADAPAVGPFSLNPGALVGKQWAMVVDMKKCWEKGKEGCKDCLLACHKVHNVPEIGNIKEEIKWIWPEQYDHAFAGQENEFIPADQIAQENPKTVLLDEVKTDINYALVISTNAGLWRYLIGDTITFTSLNPYRIKITGRTKNFINAFGEELIVDNAEKALAIACERCHTIIAEYTAAPVYFDNETKGAHEWLIEFEIPPSDTGYFTNIFDNALKSLNSDYEAKRYHNMILGEPVIRILPKGTFYTWLKLKGKLGGQYKVPRLSNERKYVEEIMGMRNEQ